MLDVDAYLRGVRRLTRLRWIASSLAFAVLAVAAIRIPGLALGPAFAVAALIPLSNVGHIVLARRGIEPRKLLLVQFGADLVLLTALLAVTGGVDGPTIPLYLFHVLLAALLVGRREALAVAVASVGCMGGLVALQLAGVPLPARQGVYSSLLGLGTPLSTLAPFVVGQVAVLAFAAVVVLALVLPLAQEARQYQQKITTSEAEAQAKRAVVEALLDNAGAMMMVLDGEHRLCWFNRGAGVRFPNLAVGQIRRCFDPAEPMGGAKPPQCPSCRVLETGEPWRGDYSLGGAAADPPVWRVYAAPIVAAAGPERVIELIVEVTQERQAALQLIETRKNAAIVQLAAGVAHELNTPLASLAAGLWSLRRASDACAGSDDGAAKRCAPLIHDLAAQTTRCQRITESMLGLSRQLRSHLGSAEIGGVVREAMKDLASCRDLSGVEVVLEGPGEEVPAVQCDANQLRLVLVNVLSNAVDSIREARRQRGRVHIRLRSADEGRVVEARIVDNGAGVPPDVIGHVFEPFFTTKPVGAGTGLGLSVSRGLLAGMGGTIELGSEPGRGAEVMVRLRAVKEAAGQAPAEAPFAPSA